MSLKSGLNRASTVTLYTLRRGFTWSKFSDLFKVSCRNTEHVLPRNDIIKEQHQPAASSVHFFIQGAGKHLVKSKRYEKWAISVLQRYKLK